MIMTNECDKSILYALAEEYIVYTASVRALSSATVDAYRRDVELCVSLLDDHCSSVEAVQLLDLQGCVTQLVQKGYSASRVNRFIAAVRSFFAYCHRYKHCVSNPAAELKTMKDHKKLPAFLFPSEVDELCAIPEKIHILWEERDRAILEMLYSSGCRVSELAGLTLDDISGDLTSARVLGKGSKERRVFFAHDAQESLRTYLSVRIEKIHADTPTQRLFINVRGNALSVRGIQYIVSEYSKRTSGGKRIFPHALRHTFATALVTNGADIRLVQEMMGHESISTTQRYTHVTTKQLMQAYMQAHPHGSDT